MTPANVNRMLVELTYQGTDWHFDQSLVEFVYFMSVSHYVEVLVDPDCYDNNIHSSCQGRHRGGSRGVRWVRMNPFCWFIRLTGSLLLPAVFDTQYWRASPVWLLYNLCAIQFNVHAVKYLNLFFVQLTKASSACEGKSCTAHEGKSGRGHPKFFGTLRMHSFKRTPFLNSWIRPWDRTCQANGEWIGRAPVTVLKRFHATAMELLPLSSNFTDHCLVFEWDLICGEIAITSEGSLKGFTPG